MSELGELKKIEFESNAALASYCRTLRNLGRDLAAELAYSTDDLLERLAAVPDSTGPLHAASRVRARLVVRQLVPARDAAAFVAHCAIATERAFTKHFAPELNSIGRKQKQNFDFH